MQGTLLSLQPLKYYFVWEAEELPSGSEDASYLRARNNHLYVAGSGVSPSSVLHGSDLGTLFTSFLVELKGRTHTHIPLGVQGGGDGREGVSEGVEGVLRIWDQGSQNGVMGKRGQEMHPC